MLIQSISTESIKVSQSSFTKDKEKFNNSPTSYSIKKLHNISEISEEEKFSKEKYMSKKAYKDSSNLLKSDDEINQNAFNFSIRSQQPKKPSILKNSDYFKKKSVMIKKNFNTNEVNNIIDDINNKKKLLKIPTIEAKMEEISNQLNLSGKIQIKKSESIETPKDFDFDDKFFKFLNRFNIKDLNIDKTQVK